MAHHDKLLSNFIHAILPHYNLAHETSETVPAILLLFFFVFSLSLRPTFYLFFLSSSRVTFLHVNLRLPVPPVCRLPPFRFISTISLSFYIGTPFSVPSCCSLPCMSIPQTTATLFFLYCFAPYVPITRSHFVYFPVMR